jgi:hypothetical protein
MKGRYSGYVNATNTASATVPMFTLVGGTTRRASLYYLNVGFDAAPADSAFEFSVKRISARGTQSASFVLTAQDPADPAATSLMDTAWAVNPTITANSELLAFGMHQRTTFQWQQDPDFGLIIPATAGAGLALLSVTAASAVNGVYTPMIVE